MKRSKKEILRALLEGLCEVVLSLVCFGIGVFIISLFGVDFKSLGLDADLVLLIGIVVFLIIFLITYFLVQYIKKRINKTID